jgi:RNA polymerase primary sigma factor
MENSTPDSKTITFYLSTDKATNIRSEAIDTLPCRIAPTEEATSMKTQTLRRDRPASELQIYLQELEATPLLSLQAEIALAGRIEEGDPAARDQMVRANLRLVVNIARRLLGRGLSLEDLIAEGNLGLMRAVEGFDPSMDVRFSTYASFWIKQSIRRALINQGKTFRLPAYMVTLVSRWRRATAVLTERLGRTPTPEEVGQALRLTKKKLRIVSQAIRVNNLMPSSHDAEGDDDGLGRLLDERSKAAPDLLVEADETERIFRRLDRLEKREAAVIRMRFGLDSYAPMSLREVGEHLGLTRERVRQLERHALQQLMEIEND